MVEQPIQRHPEKQMPNDQACVQAGTVHTRSLTIRLRVAVQIPQRALYQAQLIRPTANTALLLPISPSSKNRAENDHLRHPPFRPILT